MQSINEPWKTPVYNAQCKTFAIARRLTGDFRTATPGSDAFKPPYCLRAHKEYRDNIAQQFRDLVAKETRKERAGK